MTSPLETELIARLRQAELLPTPPHAVHSSAHDAAAGPPQPVRVVVGHWLIKAGTWLAGPPPLHTPTFRVLVRHR
jgi:hypothetical protein